MVTVVADRTLKVAAVPRSTVVGFVNTVGIVGLTIVLACNVTFPLFANALPSKVDPVTHVHDEPAKMVPFMMHADPKDAKEPTCQKILDSDALLARITWRLSAILKPDAI
jgi:hypothetical protein